MQSVTKRGISNTVIGWEVALYALAKIARPRLTTYNGRGGLVRPLSGSFAGHFQLLVFRYSAPHGLTDSLTRRGIDAARKCGFSLLVIEALRPSRKTPESPFDQQRRISLLATIEVVRPLS